MEFKSISSFYLIFFWSFILLTNAPFTQYSSLPVYSLHHDQHCLRSKYDFISSYRKLIQKSSNILQIRWNCILFAKFTVDLAYWAWLPQTSPSSSVQNLNIQSEWYAVCSVASVMSGSLQPHGQYPARLLWQWDFPGKNTGVGWWSFPSPGDLPNPGTEPKSPTSLALQTDSLLLSHQG